MEIDKTIIGLLTGSLATLIIKGIIDYFTKRVEHKRELLRITYQRKLELAEKATGYYYTYFSTIQEIRLTIKIMLKSLSEDSNLDTALLNKILKANDKTLSRLVKNNFQEINSIHLYFKLESAENWSEINLGLLYENTAEATFHSKDVSDLVDLIEGSVEDSDDHIQYSEELKSAVPIYTKSLLGLIDSLEQLQNATYKVVQEIKGQLNT